MKSHFKKIPLVLLTSGMLSAVACDEKSVTEIEANKVEKESELKKEYTQDYKEDRKELVQGVNEEIADYGEDVSELSGEYGQELEEIRLEAAEEKKEIFVSKLEKRAEKLDKIIEGMQRKFKNSKLDGSKLDEMLKLSAAQKKLEETLELAEDLTADEWQKLREPIVQAFTEVVKKTDALQKKI